MQGLLHHPNMNQSDQSSRAAPPPQVPVEFRDHCTPEFLRELVPDPVIGAFSRYAPQAADRQLAALVKVAALPRSRVLVAHCGGRLVAYLTFHPPEEDSRWASLPPGQILELGGIEVARGLRGLGLASQLMSRAFSSPHFDATIVYAQALTWCWDLEGSNLSMAGYRHMMLRLFGAHGFEPYVTDEPNIRYDRGNLLLVRIGPKTPPALVAQFQATLIEKSEGTENPAPGSERRG